MDCSNVKTFKAWGALNGSDPVLHNCFQRCGVLVENAREEGGGGGGLDNILFFTAA